MTQVVHHARVIGAGSPPFVHLELCCTHEMSVECFNLLGLPVETISKIWGHWMEDGLDALPPQSSQPLPFTSSVVPHVCHWSYVSRATASLFQHMPVLWSTLHIGGNHLIEQRRLLQQLDTIAVNCGQAGPITLIFDVHSSGHQPPEQGDDSDSEGDEYDHPELLANALIPQRWAELVHGLLWGVLGGPRITTLIFPLEHWFIAGCACLSAHCWHKAIAGLQPITIPSTVQCVTFGSFTWNNKGYNCAIPWYPATGREVRACGMRELDIVQYGFCPALILHYSFPHLVSLRIFHCPDLWHLSQFTLPLLRMLQIFGVTTWAITHIHSSDTGEKSHSVPRTDLFHLLVDDKTDRKTA
jgi:hypothetical protein